MRKAMVPVHWGKQRGYSVALGIMAAVMMAGCVSTYHDPGQHSQYPETVVASLDNNVANAQLGEIRQLIQAQEYARALGRLKKLLEQYPESSTAVNARYFLGLTYAEIGGLTEAQRYFDEYLELAPNGKYVAQVQSRKAIIDNLIAQRYLTPADLDDRITKAEQKVTASPQELTQKLELAELYWKRGDYSQSGALYIEILTDWPHLANDMTIRNRLEKQADGSYIILTPTEVIRREAEEKPLVVYNTSSFRSGRFRGWPANSRQSEYSVSGEVVNRGSTVLKNCKLFVTLYGFGSVIYDTKTVNIGTLRPREPRTFSVVFTRFDTIENIARYEVKSTFQR